MIEGDSRRIVREAVFHAAAQPELYPYQITISMASAIADALSDQMAANGYSIYKSFRDKKQRTCVDLEKFTEIEKTY